MPERAIGSNVQAYAAATEYQPRPIRNDEELARMTARLEHLDAIGEPSIEQTDIADLIALAIAAYEEKYALTPASPLEHLLELMAANGLEQKDIAELIGSKGNASELFHGKRKISRNMAAKFADRFNVSYKLFL